MAAKKRKDDFWEMQFQELTVIQGNGKRDYLIEIKFPSQQELLPEKDQ